MTCLALVIFTGCLQEPGSWDSSVPPPPPGPPSPGSPLPSCGDGVCVPGEDCSSCPADCGVCPPVCTAAIDLGTGVPVDRNDDSTAASTELDGATCGDGATGPTLHYAWTATQPGVYEITATGTFPLVLDVHQGDCNAPEADCATALATATATSRLPLDGYQTLTIVIAGQGGRAGDVHLHIERLPDACGDGVCELGEDCSSCDQDCGTCTTPPSCGDGVCDAGESCDSCPSDCGTCISYCGDGSCDAGESCDSCPSDCGTCISYCGDGSCDAGEDCSSCSSDCGTCESYCGDGSCDAGEDCDSCPSDCGSC